METAVTVLKPHSIEQCRRDIVPMADILAQVGSKWTIFVITALSGGPMRFSQLLRHIEGISQKVLTSTLRDLEKDGLVSRKVAGPAR